jgi:hypothetical protein
VSECCADVCYSGCVGTEHKHCNDSLITRKETLWVSQHGRKLHILAASWAGGGGPGVSRASPGLQPTTLNLTDWDPLVQCLAWSRVQCLGAVLGMDSCVF